MKLIKPSEISARILTLLDESDERVILVSPYMKISKWYKFMNRINNVKSRGVQIKIYVRDDPENTTTYRDLDRLALAYNKVPHLHCKLYLNERYGIVTSMNLLLSSEINSLEIGYATETWKEYNDLLSYYHRYILIGKPIHCDTLAGPPTANLQEIMHDIREKLEKNAKNTWLWIAENTLHICTGQNNYSVSINDGILRISAYLRMSSTTRARRSHHSSLIAKKIEDLAAIEVEIHPGHNPDQRFGHKSGQTSDILKLSGHARHTLKSNSIRSILKAEANFIMEVIIRFIDATDNLAV